MNVFRQIADIKVEEDLDLPKPKLKNNGKHTIVSVPASKELKEYVQKLANRAEKIHNGGVDPSIDNMLKITTEGKKIALDLRLINELYDDIYNSKINKVVQDVFKVWEETKELKLTQLLFSDLGTPSEVQGKYDVYNDIRNKLVALGVPKSEIAFIHEHEKEKQRTKLFKDFREGTVRILIGSTQKLGARN